MLGCLSINKVSECVCVTDTSFKIFIHNLQTKIAIFKHATKSYDEYLWNIIVCYFQTSFVKNKILSVLFINVQ